MAGIVLNRSERRPAPGIPAGEVRIPPPPQVADPDSGRWQRLLALLPMAGGSVAMAVLPGRDGGVYPYLMAAVFGVSTLAMLATSWNSAPGAGTRSATDLARRRYLRQLAGLRGQVRGTVDRQRTALNYRYPDPDRLWSTAASSRVWERRPHDRDFATVRVGVGSRPLATPLVPPADDRPVDEIEPLTAAALRRFIDSYSVVPGLPIVVGLRDVARIFVVGRPDGDAPDGAPAALVRAVLAQLAVLHAPDDLRIAIYAPADRRDRWEWVKWLPHAGHPQRTDATGPLRLVAGSAAELARLLDSMSPAHVVVVCDGTQPNDGTGANDRTGANDGGGNGVTVVQVGVPAPRILDRVTVELSVGPSGRLVIRGSTGPIDTGTADGLGVVEAEALARQLAPLRLATNSGPARSAAVAQADLVQLLGFGSGGAGARWWTTAGPDRSPSVDRHLRVPFGVTAEGQPVELDLKESALHGMGPHGLVVGATGSGKSELLRTLVLGLALTHPPESLNLVLIDFKGGATFAALDRLPHTAAVITNLAQELPLVDRMADALHGEVVRRQQLLRRAGNLASRQDYLRVQPTDETLPPLPSLVIVCDEFTELLTAKPDFIDIFLQIGRVGRSLGMHLVLASQRVDEGRLRGLDTHLAYQIGLRTFSALESRAVLGVPDAYHLPREPGHGFLRYGTGAPVRFRAAYVSGPYRRPAPRRAGGPRSTPMLYGFRTHPVPAAATRPEPSAAPGTSGTGASLLEVSVDRLARNGPPAHRVWLPPLGEPPQLDDLLGPVRLVPGRGPAVADPDRSEQLRVAVAAVDKPYEQRRDPLWLDLDGAAGHVAVVGAPQSGKSQLIRTLICALALSRSPAEVQVYCLDFGGGALAGLRDLPHVGGVTVRTEPATVRRTVAEVTDLLASRERRFARDGVESMAAYRARRATGTGTATGSTPDDPYGDVFLVVDGWTTLRGEYDDLEPSITDLATRGLSYGVHLVASAPRWADFRPALRDLFGSRLELRLGDPIDSLVSHRSAANVPPGSPGRGITSDGLHFLAAVADTAALVDAIADGWAGPAAPPVRLLPGLVPYAALDRTGTAGLRLQVGLAESDLRPVSIDFAADPHLLLFGEAESGKSSFLRALATTVAGRFAPEQARLIIVDYRRSLLGAVDSDHLIGYGGNASHTADLIDSAADHLRRRLPGPDLTAAQLAGRSWWTGPELFVLVDDYDLVAAGSVNPIQPLLGYLVHARDVGLHLVLARRVGGAGRALYEPFVQQLRESSAAGLVLSGDPDEGQLVGGVRAEPLPPGRGRLVTRRDGIRLVQLAYLPAADPTGPTGVANRLSASPKTASDSAESR
ncbi:MULTISPECIES: type VII secretion protein EccCb [unclassified Solwaraspora]|uniref:type VII secretion protein EccCb n=1 Tax=unclassified Solwaraspora TaxID=2627926 RepID=UPI00248C491C|nr:MULTISPECIES: type VII secretion protein EccCb [unclassified Solwaraspora]WBC00519.1 type VII secretion protein EccCb [Solwaraspora sp. WMMA2059]WBC23868.1 type VII secretion protein EccCb [Solwaraspora sp. WMMA2080]WJK37914.1 type VII secretion protein EccCb [Solwaraspora sp. WMMA2065]